MKKKTIVKLPNEFDQDYAHWKVLKRTGDIVLLEGKPDSGKTRWVVCTVRRDELAHEAVRIPMTISDDNHTQEIMEVAFDKAVERVTRRQEKEQAKIEANRKRTARNNAFNKLVGIVRLRGRDLARELKQAVSEYEDTEPQADKKIKALLTEISLTFGLAV